MLVPERNAEKLNSFLNDPSIFEWAMGDSGHVPDLGPLMKNKDNVFFTEEHGGGMFIKKDLGVYEVHALVLPDGRGSWIKEKGLSAIKWMFNNTDAEKIIAPCPRNNMAVIGAARMLGFKRYGTSERTWRQGGKEYFMDLYSLSKQDFGGR